MRLVKLEASSVHFPDPDSALQDPNGLLAIGGDLTSPRLLSAYQHGIFPWFEPGEMILWWSPDPRAILVPEERHISRSLQKFMRKMPFRFTLNRCFEKVIHACAIEREDGPGSDPWFSVVIRNCTKPDTPIHLKSGKAMSWLAVCTAFPSAGYFAASPCLAAVKMPQSAR